MTVNRFPDRHPLPGRAIGLGLAVLLTVGALAGCSAFKSKKRLDMGRFAEDMITVAGEIQYTLGQTKAVYNRDYLDTPELVTLRVKAGRAKQLVRNVIAYSIQLVTVGDSRKPDSEKAEALAGYLEDILPAVMGADGSTIGLTRAEVDTILTDIRAQTKYLDAIAAAQPIVDETAIVSGAIFDELKQAMDATISAVRRRIENRYAGVRTADEALRQRQLQTVFNAKYLAQIRTGVPGALDSLLTNEPSLPVLVDVSDGLDAEEIQRVEDRMLDVLTRLRLVREQLAPDLDMYYRQQDELDTLAAVWNAELRKARVAVVAWARAHKRMAQGVIDPADVDVLGIARKASGAVLPIP